MRKIFKLFVLVIVLVLFVMFCNTVKASGDYSSIYFYSNNEENYNACQEYIRNLALDSNISSNNIHMIVEPYDIFEEYIYVEYEAGTFNYSNALVIFDMSAGIMDNHDPNIEPELYFVRILKNIFSSLKERNCKIMFICGTQEIRFSTPEEPRDSQGNLNEFLDYVDIHVNVSTFDPFYMSMIVRIEKETNGSNATLIFDENTQLYDKVIDYYQRKYDYNNLTVDDPDYSIEKYLYDTYRFQIIRYDENSQTFMNQNGEISDDVFHLIENNVVYPIGMVNDLINFSQWADKINCAKNKFIYVRWSVFVYNQLGIGISHCNILGALYHLYAYKYGRYVVRMNSVISDFINGEDLTPYNNRYGRCQITYRPLSSGRYGWLIDFEYSDEGDGQVYEYGDEGDGQVYDFGYICIYGQDE